MQTHPTFHKFHVQSFDFDPRFVFEAFGVKTGAYAGGGRGMRVCERGRAGRRVRERERERGRQGGRERERERKREKRENEREI